MINKERLRELIKEEKMVYLVDNDFIYDIYLKEDKDNKNDITDTGLFTQWREWNKSDPLGQWFHDKYKFERLFENEDDAKEYLKYGNISREEKLELPTWEEFKNFKKSIIFRVLSKDIIEEDDTIFQCYNNGNAIIIYNDFNSSRIFNKPLTRENYDKARDVCIKLFKGEKE